MMLFETDTERTAWVSDCGRYRHSLGRHWDRSKGFALFIGLNPSIADGRRDDPTIRREMRFARDWGYGGMEKGNLYDWIATDPKSLPRKQGFAVSEFNDPTLRCRINDAGIVIACWGSVPWATKRIDELFRTVFSEDKRWHCLKLTKHGYPQHPLYVPASTKPILFW